jgi:transposase InsO family protein
MTLRLSRAQWDRVHDLARAEGVSLNALALWGLSRLCAERGVPPL